MAAGAAAPRATEVVCARPSARRWLHEYARRSTASFAVVGGWAILVVVGIAVAPGTTAVALGATGAVILVTLAGILTFTWRVRLCVTGDAVTWRSAVRSRRWERTTVARVVHMRMTSPSIRHGLDYHLGLAADSRCLFRMETAWWWSRSDVVIIAGALGLAIDSVGVLTAYQSELRYPGSAAWWLRHPWGFAIPTAVVVLAVIGGLATLFQALFR
jgi:hypothetical protein